MAHVLRKDDLAAQPWKNGGGQTYQIAVSPAGAGLTDFDWRISMAKVGQSGGFSDFYGVDRSLAILAGAGIAVEINGGAAFNLTPQDEARCFAGEEKIFASLLQGEVLDFNVMTRRASYTQKLSQLRFSQPETLVLEGEARMFFLAEGESLLCQQGELQFVLKQFDSLYLDEGDSGQWLLVPYGEVRLFGVQLNKA
ncbi:HutD family protein [Iodobacter sp. CM08]|uniref:HutD/Ves family protein n=1 Tax=Iodobacter sp. CM08 TaxID=3085902 RepID=UPI002980A6FC|nr:HutD family protein [Iodobacter sp. CM08]MDW5415223.1 HutD family protein [Iodobacter sp. CM08]